MLVYGYVLTEVCVGTLYFIHNIPHSYCNCHYKPLTLYHNTKYLYIQTTPQGVKLLQHNKF